MNPDPALPCADFVILSSGANFSCEVLEALLQKNHPPQLLVLPEYPPANRLASANRLAIATPQRRLLSLAQNIEIAYAPAPRQHDLAQLVEARKLDFLLVACWPYLLESRLIESPRKAALNLHPSLLPEYRGANPLAQQLAAGSTRFGVTLHRLDQRFDHGDIIAQAEVAASGSARQQPNLERACAARGVELFIEAAAVYPNWRPIAQTG